MGFAKGAMFGMIAGTVVGVMNSGSIMGMFKKGRRQVMRMKRRYLSQM